MRKVREKRNDIIDGISLTIDTDKFVVITGPNGGGKSTLAKLIMGIEKPTSGKIIFKGQDITNASITDIAHGWAWDMDSNNQPASRA